MPSPMLTMSGFGTFFATLAMSAFDTRASARVGGVLVQPHHAAVGPAESALRGSGAGDRARLESEMLGQAHAVTVVDAGSDEYLRGIDEFFELAAFADHLNAPVRSETGFYTRPITKSCALTREKSGAARR